MIYVRPEVRQALKVLAAERGCTIGELVARLARSLPKIEARIKAATDGSWMVEAIGRVLREELEGGAAAEPGGNPSDPQKPKVQ